MKKTALILGFCLGVLITVPAVAEDDRPNVNESSLKGGTPSDFLPQAEIDKRNEQKAKNYLSAEYVRTKRLARYAIFYDACMQEGYIPMEAISAESKFNLFINKEKSRPDRNRPANLVSDDDIADAMHRSFDDTKKKYKGAKLLFDEKHCPSIANLWPLIEKKYGVE